MRGDVQKSSKKDPNSTQGLHVEFIGDVVCPFCFLARRRFAGALASLEGPSEPRFSWQPFELNPEMPKKGVPLKKYLDSRFGDHRVIEPVLAQLTETAQFEGINFNFKALKVVPNTLDAHRLILLADKYDRQEEIIDALYTRFFELGQNVGDIDVLGDIAAETGMDRHATIKYLLSDEGVSIVRAFEHQLREAGVVAVPNIVLNGKVTIAGAQDSATIVAVLDKTLFQQADSASLSESIH